MSPLTLLRLEYGHCATVPLPQNESAQQAAATALHPDERVFAAQLAPLRAAEWVAGRLALRAALQHAGDRADAPLLANHRGAPLVPSDFAGSISHKRGLAVALAARRDDSFATLGVDLEELAAPRRDIARRVLTEAERAHLAAQPPAQYGAALMIRFALKEAIYKAIDPFVHRYVGFLEVTVWPGADGTAEVAYAGRAGEGPLAITARWQLLDAHVLATARARAVHT